MSACTLQTRWEDDHLFLEPKGDWVLSCVDQNKSLLKAVQKLKKPKKISLDFKDISSLDSIGAAQLKTIFSSFSLNNEFISYQNLPPHQEWLIEEFKAEQVVHRTRPREFDWKNSMSNFGRQSMSIMDEFYAIMSFSGHFYLKVMALLSFPKNFRIKAFVNQVKYIGIDSIPIVCLLIFLIGVVLAYQGITQLERFGAEIFVVNLLGVSILREIGVLLTSIIIAGRSGSAITAQIGSMKINREIDAMIVSGLDPYYVLILPRVFALIIVLPCLTFIADIVGIFGGAVMCYFTINLTFGQFLTQLQLAVSSQAFYVGLAKAPFFGFVIALIGTFQGFRVFESAQSLGKMTTRSVVQAIFAIIVLDAFFSVLFSMYGI